MKRFISRIRFRIVLPLLLLATVFTLPSAVTGSKYVWEEEIDLTLKVYYSNQEITRFLSASPDNTCVPHTDGVLIESTEIPGQWMLSAKEGDTLPERVVVQIGETSYSICTDGSSNPEGVAFDPETGILSVSNLG